MKNLITTLSIVISLFAGSLALMPVQTLAADEGVKLTNPLDPTGAGTADPRVILGNIIRAVLGVIGSLALVLFIYNGIQIMISTGDPVKYKKGFSGMIWTTIGLIIIFSSYAIVSYILDRIAGGAAAQ